jgi:hypothetical protein
MTLHLGYVPASSTVYIPFHTFNSSGASVTMSGLATSDILVYKNGGTTERSSTSGFTLLDTDGIDFDGKTGLHGFKIDLSDNTDAGFYAVGNHYMVAISSVTADSQTVSFWAATFWIGPQQADAIQISGDATAADNAESFFDGTGYEGTNNIIPTVTTTTNLTNAPTNGDLTAAMKASVSTAVWDAATASYGAAGSYGLLLETNIDAAISSRSSHSAADVWSVATRILTAGTNIVLSKGSGVTGFNDLDAAGVRSAVGLASANLDTQIDALPTATENADALLDRANGVESGLTPRQWMRLTSGPLIGKVSGAGTGTEVFRNYGDTKDRITATIDGDGNRTAITYDAT